MRWMMLLCVEAVLWLIAIVASFGLLVITNGEDFIVNVVAPTCITLSVVKFVMCVEIACRHYQRVVKSHKF